MNNVLEIQSRDVVVVRLSENNSFMIFMILVVLSFSQSL